MDYLNQHIRRQDRLLDEQSARELLKNGQYGVLSMQAEKEGGYAVPISYAWDSNNAIYLHCAPEGRKLRCIELCNKVSFCVVGETEIIPDKFSTYYKSIVLECKAYTELPADERKKALGLLIEKYSQGYEVKGKKYAENSFHRTEIIRLDIESWSGKSKN